MNGKVIQGRGRQSKFSNQSEMGWREGQGKKPERYVASNLWVVKVWNCLLLGVREEDSG